MNQYLSYEKNAAELHFMTKNSKKCGFFQKSGHNFFPLCFTDFFPAKYLFTYRWATRGITALKPLRPVRDELRDLNLKNTSLTPIFDQFQIIISQRQVVVEQPSLARCSRRLTYFLHAATCNTSCVDKVGLFGQKPSKNGK